jgi:hypothetical protein
MWRVEIGNDIAGPPVGMTIARATVLADGRRDFAGIVTMQQSFRSPPHAARLGKRAKNAEIFSIAVSLGSEIVSPRGGAPAAAPSAFGDRRDAVGRAATPRYSVRITAGAISRALGATRNGLRSYTDFQ